MPSTSPKKRSGCIQIQMRPGAQVGSSKGTARHRQKRTAKFSDPYPRNFFFCFRHVRPLWHCSVALLFVQDLPSFSRCRCQRHKYLETSKAGRRRGLCGERGTSGVLLTVTRTDVSHGTHEHLFVLGNRFWLVNRYRM